MVASNTFYFHPIHGEMIQFDLRICFKWVETQPPTRKTPPIDFLCDQGNDKRLQFLALDLSDFDSVKQAAKEQGVNFGISLCI